MSELAKSPPHGTAKRRKRNQLAKQIANEIIDTNISLTPQNFLNTLVSQWVGGIVGYCKALKLEWDMAKPGSNMRVTIAKLFTALMIHQTSVQKLQGGGDADVSEEELEELVQEELMKIADNTEGESEEETDERGIEPPPVGDGPA